MTRKIKVLGALVAVLAMSAIAAQGASAIQFHSHVQPVSITADNSAHGVHKFTASGVVVECTTATFRGTQTLKTEASFEVSPTYSGCKIGEVPVTVEAAGCKYKFYAETTTNPNEPTKVDAPVEITCEAGKELYFEAAKCKVKIESGKYHGVSYVNEGTLDTAGAGTIKDITVKGTVGKIKYTPENTAGAGIKCGTLGFEVGVTKEDGSYIGNATVKGFIDGDSSGVTDPQNNEGAQVGIWWE